MEMLKDVLLALPDATEYSKHVNDADAHYFSPGNWKISGYIFIPKSHALLMVELDSSGVQATITEVNNDTGRYTHQPIFTDIFLHPLYRPIKFIILAFYRFEFKLSDWQELTSSLLGQVASTVQNGPPETSQSTEGIFDLSTC